MCDSNICYKILPKCHYRVWGGNKFEGLYPGFDQSPIGEVSLLAFVEENTSKKPIPLSQFYHDNRNLFHLNDDYFPLAVNLIDAKECLSIQLHPNDKTAKSLGFTAGLSESWYVLDCEKDATICIGHHAKTRKECNDLIEKEDYEHLLREVKVKKNDYFHIPPGCLHSIKSNRCIYEITHAMDITYRLYDFDRIDIKTKKKRTLHLKEIFQNIVIPFQVSDATITVEQCNNRKVTTFIDEPGKFTLKKIETKGNTTYEQDNFYFYTVIEGAGMIQHHQVYPYDTLFVPQPIQDVTFAGKMVILAASYKEYTVI